MHHNVPPLAPDRDITSEVAARCCRSKLHFPFGLGDKYPSGCFRNHNFRSEQILLLNLVFPFCFPFSPSILHFVHCYYLITTLHLATTLPSLVNCPTYSPSGQFEQFIAADICPLEMVISSTFLPIISTNCSIPFCIGD